MKTVLIIDDNEALRACLERAVTSIGFRAVTAPDGVSGIELAQLHLPSVILCDLYMAHGDGFYVLSHLRANQMTRSIPCVLLSDGAHIAGERGQIDRNPPDAFLPKPFALEDLIKVVKLHARSSEDQLPSLKP